VSAGATEGKNGDSRAALVVIAAAFLFVGGILFLIGGRSVLDAHRYRQAVRAEAVATGRTLRVATDTSSTAYELSYRAVIEGRAQERTDTVPVHLWERTEKGGVVHVEYLPGRPDSVRAVTDGSSGNARTMLFTTIGALLILGGLAAVTLAVKRPRFSQLDLPQEPAWWPPWRWTPELFVGAIFLIVGTPLAVSGMLQLSDEWRFARSGVSTDGMVLTKEVKRSGRGQRTRTYEATYRLMVPEGAFENQARLSHAGWVRLKEREAVEVVYLPDRPSANRLAGPRPWATAAVMAVLGSVFFLIGATGLVRGAGALRAGRRSAGGSRGAHHPTP
jgi:hypothetical protein